MNAGPRTGASKTGLAVLVLWLASCGPPPDPERSIAAAHAALDAGDRDAAYEAIHAALDALDDDSDDPRLLSARLAAIRFQALGGFPGSGERFLELAEQARIGPEEFELATDWLIAGDEEFQAWRVAYIGADTHPEHRGIRRRKDLLEQRLESAGLVLYRWGPPTVCDFVLAPE